ncbi:MAG: cache domain-containing protein [Methanobacteriota archaeon]
MKLSQKLLVGFITLVLISSGCVGYLGIATMQEAKQSTGTMTRTELARVSEAELTGIVEYEAQKFDSFCVEAVEDAAGLAADAYRAFETNVYGNATFDGGLYANFGYSDWKNSANRSKILGILNGSVNDPLYDALQAICDTRNRTNLNLALSAISNGTYSTLPATDPMAAKMNVTIWSQLMGVHQLVKLKSKTGACGQFLLHEFAYGILTDDAKKSLGTLYLASESVRRMSDNHRYYDKARLDYWGNSTLSTTVLYSKIPYLTTSPFHNTYYCPKSRDIRSSGFGPQWSREGVINGTELSLRMTCSVPVCPSPLEPISQTNKMVGAVHIWIDLTTLSMRIENLTVKQTGFAFVVDEQGNIIAHPDSGMLGKHISAGDSDMNETVRSMMTGSRGVGRIDLDNTTTYVAYCPINETGWSLAVEVPESEVMQLSQDVSGAISREADNLLAWLAMSLVAFVLVGVAVAFSFTRSISRPVTEMTRATKLVKDGDLDVAVSADGEDELADLARSFNHMTSSLKRETSERKMAGRQLEIQIRHVNEVAESLMDEIGPERTSGILYDSGWKAAIRDFSGLRAEYAGTARGFLERCFDLYGWNAPMAEIREIDVDARSAVIALRNPPTGRNYWSGFVAGLLSLAFDYPIGVNVADMPGGESNAFVIMTRRLESYEKDAYML